MTQQVAPQGARKNSRKRRVLIAATATALAAGVVGVEALDTLRVSLKDNASAVSGAYVPAPQLNVEGEPFEIAYSANGEITGTGTQPWKIANTGDADASWDGVFVPDADVDEAVAAATRVRATLTVPMFAGVGWYTGDVDLDLGTLASPISLSKAYAAWVAEDPSATIVMRSSTGGQAPYQRRSVPFPSTITYNYRGDRVGRPQLSLTVTPSFDEKAVAEASTGIEFGQLAKAKASFDVTYSKR
ncbi:hypothetical protein ACFOYW_00105 [Gryllotalpicola reticulitermitis]|uniref:Alternate signal-mediated exported protein, RER_14450 family n=1 Tax=Gryllotalpicola reticulitermitis TaxID=1184153 RepID=A0ABV8Q289_9MICO